jgi:hypothetical protein
MKVDADRTGSVGMTSTIDSQSHDLAAPVSAHKAVNLECEIASGYFRGGVATGFVGGVDAGVIDANAPTASGA